MHDLLSHRHATDIIDSLSDDAFNKQEQLLFDARNYFLNLVRIYFAINMINIRKSVFGQSLQYDKYVSILEYGN